MEQNNIGPISYFGKEPINIFSLFGRNSYSNRTYLKFLAEISNDSVQHVRENFFMFCQRGVITIGNRSLYVKPLNVRTGPRPTGIPATGEYHRVYRFESEKKVCRFSGKKRTIVGEQLLGNILQRFLFWRPILKRFSNMSWDCIHYHFKSKLTQTWKS